MTISGLRSVSYFCFTWVSTSFFPLSIDLISPHSREQSFILTLKLIATGGKKKHWIKVLIMPNTHSNPLILKVLLLSCCLVAQSCLTLCDPMDCSPIRLLCPWDLPDKNTGVGCISFSTGSSWPRDRTRISCIGRQIPYHWVTREAPSATLKITKPIWE